MMSVDDQTRSRLFDSRVKFVLERRRGTRIRSTLKSWQVTRVALTKGILNVHTKDRQIRTQQFTVMVASACTELAKVKRVAELRITNFSGKQGWVFEDPGENCARVIKAPAAKLEVQVLSKTHTVPSTVPEVSEPSTSSPKR